MVWWVPIHTLFNTQPWYEVSSRGECRNILTKQLKKVNPNKEGYIKWQFVLNDGKKKGYSAHIVMAYSFDLPKRDDQIEIDHINHIRSDNRLCNLRWATKSDNCKNKIVKTEGRSGRKVKQYDLHGTYIKTWDRIKDAAKFYDIDNRRITDVCNGRRQSIGGFKWKHIVEKDLKDEIWKEYKGYFVSNKGRVKTSKGLLIKQILKNSYFDIGINGTLKRVHILVCTLFNGKKPSPKHTVDHIDRNEQNNCAENLRWATKREQATNRKDVKAVVQICMKTNKILATFQSVAEAVRETGFTAFNIAAVCKGKGKTYKKYFWKYANDITNKE